MIKSTELRKAFLKHFVTWGHTLIPSFSVKSSRSELLFTNSGMSALYNMFCDSNVRNAPLCNIQKCIRLGGKHNDYSNIGTSKQHLSLFEMMGGFSFGNYNKQYAIQLVWEFLMRLGLDANKLVITTHVMDLDTATIWKRVIGPKCNVVITYGEQNVWKAGDTGLCGACTEIHYINNLITWEILNIVFITHYQCYNFCRRLNLNCVDIGIGLERVLAILDGSFDVYSTNEIKSVSESVWPNQALSVTNRILLDHVRCSSEIISAGIAPDNTGAGYVLRKLIRRCVTELLITRQDLRVLYTLIDCFLKVYNGEQALKASSEIISVFSMEVELFLSAIKNSVAKFKRYGLTQHCYDTFGVPMRLVSVLIPNLVGVSNYVAIVYYKRDFVSSRVLLKQANCLVLSKTNLTGDVAGQIGDQGVIISESFSVIANQKLTKNERFHKVLLWIGKCDLICSDSVYVIRNTHLFELCSYCHSSLHVLIGVVRMRFESVKVLFTKVSYLGFRLDLECDNVNSLRQYIMCFPYEGYKPTRCDCWYIKCAKDITKLVKVSGLSLSFTERCCGTHANFSTACNLDYGFKQLSATKLRVEACVTSNVNDTKTSVETAAVTPTNFKAGSSRVRECYYPLPNGSSKLQIIWVSDNGFSCNESLSVIIVDLKQKTVFCSSIVLLALCRTVNKLTANFNLKSSTLYFSSNSDLTNSLVFIRSVLFLLY